GRAQAGARRPLRPGRRRHRNHRGAGRSPHRAHQRPHRAPAISSQGPPLPPRPVDAGGTAPAAAALPAAQGRRALPLAGLGARPPAVTIVEPGAPAPDFRLATEDGGTFTRDDLLGQTTVLVFYPFAFSPVCTDQFGVYQELLDEFDAQGARLYGVSCDATWSQKAFRESLGVTIPMLSDFEPKGEACRAFGVYHPGGFPQ